MDRHEAEQRYQRSMAIVAKRRYASLIIVGGIIIVLLALIAIQIDSVCERDKLILQDTTYIREQLEPVPEPIAEETEQLYRCLGAFRITYYCPCEQCCGKTNGITATGTKATAGRTIGVDPDVIPYGTEVIIDGHAYVAEDTGAITGNQIDIYCDSHTEALSMGRHETLVFTQK